MATADPSADSELCLGHLNIRSLRGKCLDIEKILTDYKIHVLALTETHLDDSVQNDKISIENFRFYRKDRKGRKQGGVGFYIDKHMTVIQRYDLDHKDLEMIWVEICLPYKRPLLVGCCYMTEIADLDQICRKIEIASIENKDMFLLGDFNINWLKESTEKKKIDFVSSVCGLTQIIVEPTRVDEKQSTSTCIDHIYTNISYLSSKSVIPQSVSDHKLIIAKVQMRELRHRNTEIGPSHHSELSEDLIKKIIENKQCSLEFGRVEDKEVERLLSLIKSCLLQTDAPCSFASICHILNSCIEQSKFPSERHKSSISCRLLEKVLLQQMAEYFNNNELFTHQHTLADITDQWIRDLENNKQVGVVFMDFSSSSDVISPDLLDLLHKLKSYRFSNSAISMMKSFLSDRNSSSCRWTDARCELPRGSCMTHFLWSVYTNDLKVALNRAHVVVSGSQLMMYHSADDYEGLKKVLRKESKVVRGWLRENRMVLKMFTSARIKNEEPVKQIQTRLRSTLSVNVEEFNWIRVLRVLLHDAPHLVWTS